MGSMSTPQFLQRCGFTIFQIETRNTGPIPMPMGVGVVCSPCKGCVRLESSTAQCVAYGETTVCPYLCIFYLSPVLGTSTVVPPLHQKGLLCLGRTLFPSMASITLP